jgi:hypothetical protein
MAPTRTRRTKRGRGGARERGREGERREGESEGGRREGGREGRREGGRERGREGGREGGKERAGLACTGRATRVSHAGPGTVDEEEARASC